MNLTKDSVTVQFLNQSEPRVDIMGLSHSIEYGVEVRGYTAIGPGPWSVKKLVVTPEGGNVRHFNVLKARFFRLYVRFVRFAN